MKIEEKVVDSSVGAAFLDLPHDARVVFSRLRRAMMTVCSAHYLIWTGVEGQGLEQGKPISEWMHLVLVEPFYTVRRVRIERM